ncbi:hypothetical protein IWX47DRAFT_25438 [Phyllosticta citricarpa]
MMGPFQWLTAEVKAVFLVGFADAVVVADGFLLSRTLIGSSVIFLFFFCIFPLLRRRFFLLFSSSLSLGFHLLCFGRRSNMSSLVGFRRLLVYTRIGSRTNQRRCGTWKLGDAIADGQVGGQSAGRAGGWTDGLTARSEAGDWRRRRRRRRRGWSCWDRLHTHTRTHIPAYIPTYPGNKVVERTNWLMG